MKTGRRTPGLSKKRLLCGACVLLLLLLCSCSEKRSFEWETPEQALEKAAEAMLDCCFDAEYGEHYGRLIRWEEPVRIAVRGEYTNEDLIVIGQMINEICSRVLTLPPIRFALEGEAANAVISFVPMREMSTATDGYREGNEGFVSWNWENYTIRQMKVAIATDCTDRATRSHLIREEFLQGLGVQDDLDSYSDSIFYRPFTETQELSPVDHLILYCLYHPELRAGMDKNEARQALKELCALPLPEPLLELLGEKTEL